MKTSFHLHTRWIVCALALLVVPLCLHAQESTPKRPVTIYTTEGAPLRGDLIRADSQVVVIKSGVAETTIKLDDVMRIDFKADAEDETPPAHKAPSNADVPAYEAIKALNRLAGAIEVGVTYFQYGPLVVQAKTAVDESLASVPDAEIRAEIARAMEDYAIAGQAWSESIQHRNGIPADSALAARLNERYNLWSGKAKKGETINRQGLLQRVWASARQRTNRAAELLKKSIERQ